MIFAQTQNNHCSHNKQNNSYSFRVKISAVGDGDNRKLSTSASFYDYECVNSAMTIYVLYFVCFHIRRYDLLFGLTEMESYHALNAVGLSHGLLENERDAYLRNYMQNHFDIRPDVALALTLQEYMDIYTNPERPLPEEHRDTVLEILSDAEVAAPLVQTGLYQSKVNPRSYMYVFAHNSKAGEFANVSIGRCCVCKEMRWEVNGGSIGRTICRRASTMFVCGLCHSMNE